MLIDWFTVGAQAINFLILVWLLKTFSLPPGTGSHRRARKEDRGKAVGRGDARVTGASGARRPCDGGTKLWIMTARACCARLRMRPPSSGKRFIEAARQDAALLRTRLTESLAKERAELNRRLLADTQAEVLGARTRCFEPTLAGVSLEDRMIEIFTSHLRELRLAGKDRATADAAVVRSAFEISSAQRPGIEAAIHHYLGADANIRFEISPGLVCGIELRWAERSWHGASRITCPPLLKSLPSCPRRWPTRRPRHPSAIEAQHGS